MENQTKRDFSTISPSAKALLIMKGLTEIPYAKEASEALADDDIQEIFSQDKNPAFWGRLVHFENRYWSIDQLLEDAGCNNVLELSSGFSFRGLSLTQTQDMHYIDTDLEGVIEGKNRFISSINVPENAVGKLEMLPLNALDEDRFMEIVDHFGEGPIAIVNEGLLMYLGVDEKKQLCSTIHRILSERGGCWITADFYVKTQMNEMRDDIDDKLSKFFEQHNIQGNMFDSFDHAANFFKEQGFVLEKKADVPVTKITAIKYLMEHVPAEQLDKMAKAMTFRETWRLRIA